MKVRWVVVALCAVVMLACAPRVPYSIKQGDRAYERGEYTAALEQYKKSKAARADQGFADERITRTEKKIAELELAATEKLFAAGKFEDGMEQFMAARAVVGAEHPAIKQFIAAQEPRVLAEAEARANGGKLGWAYLLTRQTTEAFRSMAAAKRTDEYKARWSTELTKAAAAADQARLPATAVVYRMALTLASSSRAMNDEAKRAAATLLEQHRLTLQVTARGDAARVTSQLATDPRFTRAGGTERVELTAVVGALGSKTDTTTKTKTMKVESGTRAVPNNAHQQIQNEIDSHQDRIATLKERRAYRVSDPNASVHEQKPEDYDREIEGVQADLDDARANLARTPATLEEPAFVDHAFKVTTSTLTVTRDVSAEARFASGGQPVVAKETFALKKSDDSNAADPRVGLAADPVQIPQAQAVSAELDKTIATWFTGVLDQVHGAYRERLLSSSKLARGEALALYVLLAPGAVSPALAAELETALSVPRPARLVDAFLGDKLAKAYAITDVAKPASTTKATAAKPVAATKPVATTRPATTKAPTVSATSPTTARVETPVPARDPMLEHAGYSLAIVAFEIRRGPKLLVKVDRDGKLFVGATMIGVWKPTGVFEDSTGKPVLVISKNGDVWFNERGPKKRGSLKKGSLAFEAGVTLSTDGAGHVVATDKGTARVSEEVVAPATAAKSDLAALVSYFAIGRLRLKTR